jgi:uncharacterized membrane protein YqjE
VADPDELRQPGRIGSALSQLAANAIALVRTRLELASVELQETTGRVKELLILAVCGALLGIFTLLFASIFVIVCFWDTHPLAAVGGVTLFYLVLTIAVGVRLRQRVDGSPMPFAATLAELENDVASLRNRR